MKTYCDCIPCFVRQALQAARFAGADAATEERVLRAALRALEQMDWNGSPMVMARVVHGIVRRETGREDPYREQKQRDNRCALDWYAALAKTALDGHPPVETALRLAIAGNMIDYGANASVDVASDLDRILAAPLAVSDEADLLRALGGARTLAYLADNAGEIVFDRLLLEAVHREYGAKACLFVTRREAFLNDALFADVEAAGLTRLPGLEAASLPPLPPTALVEPADIALWQRIRAADVIISKGQGNYERFSGEDRIYFLLVVKCPVIARDLAGQTGVPVGMGSPVLWRSRAPEPPGDKDAHHRTG